MEFLSGDEVEGGMHMFAHFDQVVRRKNKVKSNAESTSPPIEAMRVSSLSLLRAKCKSRISSTGRTLVGLCTMYMNCKAAGNQAYVPTELEHIANVITHGLCILPSLLGLVFLVQQATNRVQYFNALIYGFSLVALFSVSTTFHSIFYLGRFRFLKEILHRCDRAVIYLFIAASYTPWLNLKEMPPSCFAVHVRWLVWFMALLGIMYQQLFHERYKWLETVLYLIMGVSPAFAIVEMEEASGLNELALGGFLYITGVIFFKSDGRIPCAHAIWHMFVGVGALCHYLAVSRYLMGKHNEKYLHQSFKL